VTTHRRLVDPFKRRHWSGKIGYWELSLRRCCEVALGENAIDQGCYDVWKEAVFPTSCKGGMESVVWALRYMAEKTYARVVLAVVDYSPTPGEKCVDIVLARAVDQRWAGYDGMRRDGFCTVEETVRALGRVFEQLKIEQSCVSIGDAKRHCQ